MKYGSLLLAMALLIACGSSAQNLENDMIENPETQAEKDQNKIVKYAMENDMDVKRTESGIYYTIEKEGEGEHPTTSSKVTAHYKGYLLDGQVFDSSYKRGQPLEFGLGQVIPGWQEAIPMLKKGGKGTFIIPSGLAYGQRGAGNAIPPNAVLVFEIELVDFQ